MTSALSFALIVSLSGSRMPLAAQGTPTQSGLMRGAFARDAFRVAAAQATTCGVSTGNECAGSAAAAFAWYAGIGAAVGALIGASHQREQIIYRAP